MNGLEKVLRKMDIVAALALAGVMTMTSCASTADKAQRAAQNRQYVQEQLAAENFKIKVDYMYPQRYPSRPIMSDFWLEMKEGSVNSYLPYFGQVHMPSLYSIDEGLNFETPIQNYTKRRNERKHRTEIQFNAKSRDDYYAYSIYIYDDGNADISVHSNRRDAIRYSGELE
ncbi:MAG: DUF4251 domain-containing protein [Bacteroidaceae bacterium]|nr:DUF4251 domain-containing protein [Bacteroidaceae bacterium]